MAERGRVRGEACVRVRVRSRAGDGAESWARDKVIVGVRARVGDMVSGRVGVKA